MKKLLLMVAVLTSYLSFAQNGMNLGCTNCAIQNRWQNTQHITKSGNQIVYSANTSGTYGSNQTWIFDHVNGRAENIFQIKNGSEYLVRTSNSSVALQTNPSVVEESYWEILMIDGFAYINTPCMLSLGLHMENLTGQVQFSQFQYYWHSSQWVLKDAGGSPTLSSAPGVQNMTVRECDIPEGIDVNNLSSDSQSTPVFYLNFDGETVNIPFRGNVTAAPSEISDAWKYAVWKAVSEDFAPFAVNVTTNRSVFYAAPSTKRQMVIITPTKVLGGDVGGLAFHSYGKYFGFEVAAFAYNQGHPQAIWDVVSHELGHTLRLEHDGRTTPTEEYFGGHGDWGPIMGSSYSRRMSQWSKGEYQNASNTQDDLAKISSYIPYRNDDYTGVYNLSTNIINNSTSEFQSISGLIERNTDTDQFGFTVYQESDVTFNLKPAIIGANLNIGANILDVNGGIIATYNPAGPENNFTITLPAGNYRLEIDGVGEGNPLTDGYSDYGSLGSYTIEGKIEVLGIDLLSLYDVPRAAGIPNGFRQYQYVHTIGDGGPNLSNVFNSVFNWWGNSNNPNGLYQFTLETTNGNPRSYTNLTDYANYSLHQSSPEININSNSGFSNLGGNYWVTLDGSNLVLVEKTGNYALYFSNSSTPPAAASTIRGAYVEELVELEAYPNPFNQSISLSIPSAYGECDIQVSGVNGSYIQSFSAEGKISLGDSYEPGIYVISISNEYVTEHLKVIKN